MNHVEIISNLMNTFKSIVNIDKKKTIVEKATIIAGAEQIFRSIEENTIPSLQMMIESNAEEINKDNGLLADMRKMFSKSMKAYGNDIPKEYHNTNIEVVYVIRAVLEDLLSQKDKILTVLNNNLQQFIGSETTTLKDMSIISFIDSINTINEFTLDFCLYIVFLSNEDTQTLNKNIRERVRAGMSSFTSNIQVIHKDRIKEFLKDLPKNSSVEMQKVSTSSSEDILNANKDNGEGLSFNGMENFVYNPIYHIRLWYADRKHENYKKDIIKKNLIIGKITAIRDGSVTTFKDKNVVIDKLMTELAEIERDIIKYQEDVLR